MTTNKEAIEHLKWIRSIRPYSFDKIKVQESIDLAIKVLEERPQGEWNYIQAGMTICPFCGATPHKQYKNFCPKCGAQMLGGEE